MFLRFLADDGTGLVAPGTPIGSRNRGFSLSFSIQIVFCCFWVFFWVGVWFLRSHTGHFGPLLLALGSPVAPLLAVLVQQFYDFNIFYFSKFCWFSWIVKNTPCFLGFWPMLGLAWWPLGLPLGLVTVFFHWVLLPGGTAEAGWRTTWEPHEYPYI